MGVGTVPESARKGAHIVTESTLVALLHPFQEDLFLRDILGQNLLAVGGESGKFAPCISWADINGLLARGGLNLSRLSVKRGPEQLPPSAFSRVGLSGAPHVQAAQLRALLLEGSVAYLDSLEESLAVPMAICEALQNRLAVPVTASARISFREPRETSFTQGDGDTFLLQVCGRSQWVVQLPDPEAFPPDMSPDSGRVPRREGYLLMPGNLLYIPNGWQYCDRSMNEPSITLTLSFRSPTGRDISGRLLEQLSPKAFMSRHCNPFGDANTRSQYLTRLQGMLTGACAEPGLVEGYFKDMRAMSDPARALGLPWSICEDATALSPGLRLVPLVRFADSIQPAFSSDDFDVFFDGRIFSLSGHAGRFLLDLMTKPGIAVGEWLPNADESACRQSLAAVSELLTHGLIAVCE